MKGLLARTRPASAARWVALGVAGALALAGAAWGGEADLPTFRQNLARTGHAGAGPEPPLELRWKFKTRRGAMEIESFPAVDDGLSAATVHKGVVYAGGHDGFIYALRAETGERLWEFRTGKKVNSTPAVHGGRVFVGSMDGFLYALRADDGALEWKFASGSKVFRQISYGGVRSSPAVWDGRVFFGG